MTYYLYVIACDLPDLEKNPKEYQCLYDALDEIGAKRAQGSVWYVYNNDDDDDAYSLWSKIEKRVKEKLPDLDFMVCTVRGKITARNMRNDVRNWLEDNAPAL